MKRLIAEFATGLAAVAATAAAVFGTITLVRAYPIVGQVVLLLVVGAFLAFCVLRLGRVILRGD